MFNTTNFETSAETSGNLEMSSHTDLEARIAEAAYYKAERRAFTPGHEMEDWLEAEQEVLECEGIIHCTKAGLKAPRKAA